MRRFFIFVLAFFLLRSQDFFASAMEKERKFSILRNIDDTSEVDLDLFLENFFSAQKVNLYKLMHNEFGQVYFKTVQHSSGIIFWDLPGASITKPADEASSKLNEDSFLFSLMNIFNILLPFKPLMPSCIENIFWHYDNLANEMSIFWVGQCDNEDVDGGSLEFGTKFFDISQKNAALYKAMRDLYPHSITIDAIKFYDSKQYFLIPDFETHSEFSFIPSNYESSDSDQSSDSFYLSASSTELHSASSTELHSSFCPEDSEGDECKGVHALLEDIFPLQ